MAPPPAMPKPIPLKNVRINGFAAGNAAAGETLPVLVRAELTSDQPEFHAFMQSVTHLVVARAKDAGVLLSIDDVSTILLVVHADGTAELYLQDVPRELEILAKRDMAKGEVIFQSGVGDVRRLRMSWLELKPTDRILMCFKVGWKFGLFFDLDPKGELDVERMERSLGQLYRRLSFQELYDAFNSEDVFAKLVSAGWFPFVETIGGEFEILLKAYKNDFNIAEEKEKLLKRFDAERIDAMGQRWWKRPSLKNRQAILEPALEAFKRGDPVSCLKIVLTEIEGVLQDEHIIDVGRGGSAKELLAFAAERATRKATDPNSLLFPQQFLRYMSDYTYAKFDPKNPQADVMSRHSTGHGGAAAAAYTQERALQALLTLDQISFYL